MGWILWQLTHLLALAPFCSQVSMQALLFSNNSYKVAQNECFNLLLWWYKTKKQHYVLIFLVVLSRVNEWSGRLLAWLRTCPGCCWCSDYALGETKCFRKTPVHQWNIPIQGLCWNSHEGVSWIQCDQVKNDNLVFGEACRLGINYSCSTVITLVYMSPQWYACTISRTTVISVNWHCQNSSANSFCYSHCSINILYLTSSFVNPVKFVLKPERLKHFIFWSGFVFICKTSWQICS